MLYGVLLFVVLVRVVGCLLSNVRYVLLVACCSLLAVLTRVVLFVVCSLSFGVVC